MSFLAPLFLAGLALIAGPILFHLIRQAPRNRILFSSTELLDPSEPKTEKRRRIQNPWLLLLRCLIIALLAFAFARPFFPDSQNASLADSQSRDIVIAIDQSASMQRAGIHSSLVTEFTQIIESLKPLDRVSVIGFTDTISTLIGPSQWSAWPIDQRASLAKQVIANSQASTLPGHLDLGIEAAIAEIENLREASSRPGLAKIYLLSDFAIGSSLAKIPGIEWPGELSLSRVKLTPISTVPNLGLRWLGWGESEPGVPAARIAISNAVPELSSAASIALYDGETGSAIGQSMQVLLQGKTEEFISFPVNPNTQTRPLRFQLSGDADSFDNTLYVAPEFIPELQVSLLSTYETDDSQQSGYFIKKAVEGFHSPRVTLDSTNLPGLRSQALIIDRPLTSNEVGPIRSELEAGKIAFVLVSSPEYSDTLRSLSGDNEWTVEQSVVKDLLIGKIDFSHPLFAPFADARFSNFANIRTWKGFKISYPDSNFTTVLARFDDGTPLLTETKVGKGSLFVWASDWSPPASQWVLSSKFIPFLHRFALLATGGPPLPNIVSYSTTNLSRYQNLDFSIPPAKPGLFLATTNSGTQRWVAFQLDPEESKTQPILDDDWDKLGLPELSESAQAARLANIVQEQQRESATQAEQRQHVWQWLLWCVLALLATESVIAIMISRQKETALS